MSADYTGRVALVTGAASGIGAATAARLRAAGFDAFLIGESLMREPDPARALSALLTGAGEPREVSA